MIRIVFMGTPQFAVPTLQQLITAQNVVGVVTQPDRPAGRGRRLQASPVKIVAEAAGIPVYQPPSLRNPEAAMPLREWRPDLIVVVAFGQILRPHVLSLPPGGCLNVHASLLPRWRGAAPIHHAILAGDSETGVSLMRLDEGLDTGPVYLQGAISIGPDDTTGTLQDRLAELGAEMLVQNLDGIWEERLLARPQDDHLSTYAPMLKKSDGMIDWGKEAAYIDRHIRALTPWPGAYTTWESNALKVLKARAVKGDRFLPGFPGQVISYQGTAAVLTGAGILRLDQVQLAGKRPAPAQDFLRGRPEFIGAKLGG